jgi:uncharacterized protein
MSNHLAQETSPYLRQHADNPVDWHPWGEEALRKAREGDKPILLSIGYSTCHWCHVMAHESFEDPEVAAVMNRLFVNIKVDREERPDLDQIYQTAHQLLTGRAGGWPLNMFLTPDQKPFYGGTYFPKSQRYNLPGFVSLLENVSHTWRERRQEIEAQNASLLDAIGSTVPSSGAAALLNDAPLLQASAELKESFDPVWGGFSGAPKFPRPPELDFLLRYSTLHDDAQAAEMVLFTLRKMAEGGIYDQLGGGFCRYSVDDHWAIPHFEKMLYDNGQLLALFASAFTVSGDKLFEKVVEETVGWLLREMTAPEGGFYSALDADSEHEEGKFYVWKTDEVRGLLDEEEYRVAVAHYGFDRPANFENHAWNPVVASSVHEVGDKLGLPAERVQALLESARAKLFAARGQRVRPGRDEKILTAWNALTIKGLARAGRVFGRPDWIEAAMRAMDFLRGGMVKDGRLLASYNEGQARLDAYLDDHAFLLDAALELLQSEFRIEDFEFSRWLAGTLLDAFEDKAEGGFFFTRHDHEALIHRLKPGFDNATPAGNGVAAYALNRMGHLLGEPGYLESAERALRLYAPMLTRHPSALASFLISLEEVLRPPCLIVLTGPGRQIWNWRAQIARRYLPNILALAPRDDADRLPASLAKTRGGQAMLHVCRASQCLPPVDDLDKAISLCSKGFSG